MNDFQFEGLSGFVSNIVEGLGCILWGHCYTSDDRYQDVDCSVGAILLLVFVLCNILVVYAIERIVRVEANLLGRSITTAFFTTFVAFLFFYQDDSSSGILFIQLAAFAALASGLELFYSEPEHDVEVSTNFASVTQ